MTRLSTLIVAACVALATAPARANDFFTGGMPWFGYGYSGSLYGLGYVPVPPYFAIHPPVQYSHVVAHPYGYSPFAARVHEQRLAVEITMPHAIVNPFVVPTAAAPGSSAPSRVIENPFCKSQPAGTEQPPPAP